MRCRGWIFSSHTTRIASLLTLVAFTVGGCKVGPNYNRPVVKAPTEFRDLQEHPVPPQTASFADLPWWQVFQDPQLQELIRTALKQNYDLQLATERITAARGQLAVTRSALFPQISGNANFSGGQENLQQSRYNFLLTTADAAFQVDLFGRLRRATEASRAQLLATEDAQHTVILTLVSDVASDYFELLQMDLELQITLETVRTQEDSVKLNKFRVEHGVATKLDVLQAQQVLDTANAQLPELEREIALEENAISILLGNYPQSITRGHPLVEQPLPPEVPGGITSALLERRPDIQQAEHTLVAANAEIGVAKASFFPQISLTAAGGGAFGRSSAFSGLMGSQFGIYSYGASVSQPIFTGGALTGNLHIAKSEYRQALISYQQSIQQAFTDVSNALIDYQKFHQVRLREQDSVADLQESVRLSKLRYSGGTTTYLEVLDGQRSLFSEELNLATARGNEYQSLVQLYRSLGGGWRQ
jgi:outer membrane protein, multidrug efflux system